MAILNRGQRLCQFSDLVEMSGEQSEALGLLGQMLGNRPGYATALVGGSAAAQFINNYQGFICCSLQKKQSRIAMVNSIYLLFEYIKMINKANVKLFPLIHTYNLMGLTKQIFEQTILLKITN